MVAHTLRVEGEEIPISITQPVKCLGKWCDSSLGDIVGPERCECESLAVYKWVVREV